MPSLPFIDVVATVVVVIPGGQGPASTVPTDDLGPTNSPLSVPPAVIVYVTPQANPLSVIVDIPLVVGAVPECVNVYISLKLNLYIYIINPCTYAHASTYLKVRKLINVCMYVGMLFLYI